MAFVTCTDVHTFKIQQFCGEDFYKWISVRDRDGDREKKKPRWTAVCAWALLLFIVLSGWGQHSVLQAERGQVLCLAPERGRVQMYWCMCCLLACKLLTCPNACWQVCVSVCMYICARMCVCTPMCTRLICWLRDGWASDQIQHNHSRVWFCFESFCYQHMGHRQTCNSHLMINLNIKWRGGGRLTIKHKHHALFSHVFTAIWWIDLSIHHEDCCP